MPSSISMIMKPFKACFNCIGATRQSPTRRPAVRSSNQLSLLIEQIEENAVNLSKNSQNAAALSSLNEQSKNLLTDAEDLIKNLSTVNDDALSTETLDNASNMLRMAAKLRSGYEDLRTLTKCNETEINAPFAEDAEKVMNQFITLGDTHPQLLKAIAEHIPASELISLVKNKNDEKTQMPLGNLLHFIVHLENVWIGATWSGNDKMLRELFNACIAAKADAALPDNEGNDLSKYCTEDTSQGFKPTIQLAGWVSPILQAILTERSHAYNPQSDARKQRALEATQASIAKFIKLFGETYLKGWGALIPANKYDTVLGFASSQQQTPKKTGMGTKFFDAERAKEALVNITEDNVIVLPKVVQKHLKNNQAKFAALPEGQKTTDKALIKKADQSNVTISVDKNGEVKILSFIGQQKINGESIFQPHTSALGNGIYHFAGEMSINDNGEIDVFTNKSGHNLPHPTRLAVILEYLNERGLLADNIIVQFCGPGDNNIFKGRDAVMAEVKRRLAEHDALGLKEIPEKTEEIKALFAKARTQRDEAPQHKDDVAWNTQYKKDKKARKQFCYERAQAQQHNAHVLGINMLRTNLMAPYRTKESEQAYAYAIEDGKYVKPQPTSEAPTTTS